MTCADRLDTRHRVLDDGRRVTLRHAVPSDAPRLTLLGAEFDGGNGHVALDDGGRIVGHAGGVGNPVVSDGWIESELGALLEDQSREE
jgi:hypothetical protein